MTLYLRTMMQTARMLFEAQSVITVRSLGAAGLAHGHDQEETLLMVTEKYAAALQSSSEIWNGLQDGDSPIRIYSRALEPYGTQTEANFRRLVLRQDGQTFGPH